MGDPADGTGFAAGGVVDSDPLGVGELLGEGELVGLGERLGVRDGLGDQVGLGKDRGGLEVAEGLTAGWVDPAGACARTGRTRM